MGICSSKPAEASEPKYQGGYVGDKRHNRFVGDYVSVPAYNFDTVSEVAGRWSYQTYGKLWRSAKCAAITRAHKGNGIWQPSSSFPSPLPQSLHAKTLRRTLSPAPPPHTPWRAPAAPAACAPATAPPGIPVMSTPAARGWATGELRGGDAGRCAAQAVRPCPAHTHTHEKMRFREICLRFA